MPTSARFRPTCGRFSSGCGQTIRASAPDAQETISYGIPAFTLDGALVYFAAFKSHIGLYPPVSGDARLVKAVAPYAGEKGNLRFPLGRPHSLPADRKNRETESKAEPGEGGLKRQAPTIARGESMSAGGAPHFSLCLRR
jgi:hypothetical protein